jgi:hypothetical protein
MCSALLAQTYVRDGGLITAANVLFLQLAPARWVRFFFDSGEFFWREVPAPDVIDAAIAAPGDAYPLVDLAYARPIAGHRVEQVRFQDVSVGELRLELGFDSGVRIALVNADDLSHVEFNEAAI